MTNHTKPIRIHHSCGMCRIWDTWSDVFLRKCFFWVFLQSSISVQWFDILISRLISSLRCLICYSWCFLQYEELQLKNIKKARIARFLFDSSHQRSVGFGFFSCFLIQKSFTFMFLSHKARRVFSHLRPHAEEFKSYFIILANKESAWGRLVLSQEAEHIS